jgi:hypothetical protein
MVYRELAQIDMSFHPKVRNPSRDRIRKKVMLHTTAIITITIAGFLVGGASIAAAFAVSWAAVLIVRWRIGSMRSKPLTVDEERRQSTTYANFEDVNDCLEEIAQRRNWDLDKRFDIARLACENRTTTFDELERRYDRGARSAFSRLKQDTSRESNSDDRD